MKPDETPSRSLVIERKLSHPASKVWRALTQGALMEEWLMKNDFQPVVGHRFTLRSEPNPHWNGIIECQVLAVEPNQRLSYSWGSLGLESTVTFTLTPMEGGVLLRMEQSGFPTGAGRDQYYQGAKYGWTRFLDALQGVVAKLD